MSLEGLAVSKIMYDSTKDKEDVIEAAIAINIVLTVALALIVYFDGNIPLTYRNVLLHLIPILLFVNIAIGVWVIRPIPKKR